MPLLRFAVVGTIRSRERHFACETYRQASRIAWHIIGKGATDVAIIDREPRTGDDALVDVTPRLVT